MHPVTTKRGLKVNHGSIFSSSLFFTGSLLFLEVLSTTASWSFSFCFASDRYTLNNLSLSCEFFLGTWISSLKWVSGQIITTSWSRTLTLSTSSMAWSVKKPGQLVKTPDIFKFQLVLLRDKTLWNVSSLRMLAFLKIYLKRDSSSEILTFIEGGRWGSRIWYKDSPFPCTPKCSTFAGFRLLYGWRRVRGQSASFWQVSPLLQDLVVNENGVLVWKCMVLSASVFPNILSSSSTKLVTL